MGGACGGETDEKETLTVGKDQEHNESDHEGEESEEEKKKEEPKPDNKPYEALSGTANKKAWEQFLKDMHEKSNAAKGAGLKNVEKPQTEKNGDQYVGTLNDKGKYEGWGVWVKKKTGDIY